MRTSVALYPGFLTQGYRYMYEKLNEKGRMINEHVELLGEQIASHYDFLDTIADPAQTVQESVKTYGRICSDSDARLNDKSVVLECSRQVGNGVRVPLNLNSVPSYALFPGQVVGMEGVHGAGKYFTVQHFLPVR